MNAEAETSRSGVLVLSGYAIRIRVERGHLIVEDGVGQHRRSARFARPARDLRRLVVLGHSGTVSVEALRWLSDIGAAFVQIDSDANVISAAGPFGRKDAKLRRAQALAAENGTGLAISKQLVNEKLDRQYCLLERLPNGYAAKAAIRSASVRVPNAATVEELRALEAEGALAYWKTWSAVDVRFASQHQPRVPARWLQFGRRGSEITGNPRNATDPANALLNYLYAITEAEARIAALAVGLDPGIGIMHADQGSRDSLACDLMEPVRPVVDRWVLKLLQDHAFSRREFFETRKGICRIMPPLTKTLAETAPSWAAEIAPIAERTARQLLGTEQTPTESAQDRKILPTPLTRANRRARFGNRIDEQSGSSGRVPRDLQRNCERCGTGLTTRAQRFCKSCAPIAFPNPLAEKLRTNAAWERTAGQRPDRESYLRDIAPKLSQVPINAIILATGLSKVTCQMIRSGRFVPHPRHWEALSNLRTP